MDKFDQPPTLDYASPPPRTKPPFLDSRGAEALISILVQLAIVIPAIVFPDKPAWLYTVAFIGSMWLADYVGKLVRPWCEHRFPKRWSDDRDGTLITQQKNSRYYITRVVSVIVVVGAIYFCFGRR